MQAWKLSDGSVSFVAKKSAQSELKLPCGQCIGCRLERSRQWAIRCVHEAQLHKSSLFVTLTYSDEHLPKGGTLQYRDYQLFMKRLRKKVGPLRFYMCGEYGEVTWRPHYHACLFGVDFPDRKVIGKGSDGSTLWRSPTLEGLWPLGHSSFGHVTFESAAYVARYVLKKRTGPNAAEHYARISTDGEVVNLTPEFSKMSLRPAIGRTWLERYENDVYNTDSVRLRGKEMKPPRYYDNWLKATNAERFESLELGRYEKSQKFLDDNHPDRLKVREQVAMAQYKQLKRGLE